MWRATSFISQRRSVKPAEWIYPDILTTLVQTGDEVLTCQGPFAENVEPAYRWPPFVGPVNPRASVPSSNLFPGNQSAFVTHLSLLSTNGDHVEISVSTTNGSERILLDPDFQDILKVEHQDEAGDVTEVL